MKLNDDKYRQRLLNEMQDIVKENSSFIDLNLYRLIADGLRNESDEGKVELYETIKNSQPSGDHEMADSIRALHHAFCLFEAHGAPQWASKMLQIMAVLGSMNATADKYVEIKIREDKSRAGKGKTSRHKETALIIAKDTWSIYPNASLAGMASEIYVYLHQQWVDAPEMETIKRWLKAEKIAPDVKVKNKNFKLVINKEG